MCTDQGAEGSTAFLDGGELMRTGLIEVCEIGGEEAGGVGDPVADVGEVLPDRGQLGIGRPLQHATRLGDECRSIGLALFVRERAVGEGGRETQLFGIGETLRACSEVLVLPGSGAVASMRAMASRRRAASSARRSRFSVISVISVSRVRQCAKAWA